MYILQRGIGWAEYNLDYIRQVGYDNSIVLIGSSEYGSKPLTLLFGRGAELSRAERALSKTCIYKIPIISIRPYVDRCMVSAP